ncbi:MAG TPA: S8 family serine peptidase [Casimicrobiaceae bacterium]|nr:S8 family serine peptidase [Casimicrobiaceae bacterium]
MAVSEGELVVVVKPALRLRATATGLKSLAGVDVAPLASVVDAAGATLKPLFGASEDRLEHVAATLAASGAPVPQLSHYYAVHGGGAKLAALAAKLRKSSHVDAAYVKPPAELPGINDMKPKAAPAPASTPDFSARQGYLDIAPGGVDARYAWTQAGGRGTGVRIIDIENGWNFAHEDLLQGQGGVVGGTALTGVDWVNHGTAVLGVFSGDGVGVKGVAPDAIVSAIAATSPLTTSSAIVAAANRLVAGDLILIELHRPGPNTHGDPANAQQGYLPIEWWPDDYDAIRYATGKGIIVVETAGNGGEDLDDVLYDAPAAGFPATWSNPFRRGAFDSGAILVGAGAPPPNTHGANWGPDRARLDFSNYGDALDVQAWGREVTTTGYGDLQGGADANAWYTDTFAGTSSAGAIVVGVLGCAQGVKRAQAAPLLTPATARALLRATGSPQQASPAFPVTQRIGNRPNLRQMLGTATEADVPVPLHRYWNAQIPDHFYTTNWAELGAGVGTWQYEGIACRVHANQAAGTVPLYRYWNSSLGDHFFTTDYSELGAGKFGWVFEGTACYVHAQPGPGLGALYRYWNSQGRDHFYTTDFSQLGTGALGWVYEKVQCYVHL